MFILLLLSLIGKDMAQRMQGAALLCKQQNKSKQQRGKRAQDHHDGGYSTTLFGACLLAHADSSGLLLFAFQMVIGGKSPGAHYAEYVSFLANVFRKRCIGCCKLDDAHGCGIQDALPR